MENVRTELKELILTLTEDEVKAVIRIVAELDVRTSPASRL